MRTDDEQLALCLAAVRRIDPGVTIEPRYRAEEPGMIAGIRVTLAPGATTDTRKEAKRALNLTALARWTITYGGDNLPS